MAVHKIEQQLAFCHTVIDLLIAYEHI